MKSAFQALSEENQKEFWASLALRYCPHLTQRMTCRLLKKYHSAYGVFCYATGRKNDSQRNEIVSDTTSFLQNSLSIPDKIVFALRQEKWRDLALLEWQESKIFYGEIILWTDYRYPLELRQLVDAPTFFYVKGDISLLNAPSVAIVGSRKFHSESVKRAFMIAKDLSSHGICVISGMAKGIDYAAHDGALQGVGKTIAVLGTGADIIYPKENAKIYERIQDNGLILSEFSPNAKPDAKNFPIRNRIISGLSAAVLVAEAAPRSGSLITARLALEQNRQVYALKPVHENHSLGCQSLINDGALEVEDALAIIVDIAPHLQEKVAEFQENSLVSKETVHENVKIALQKDTMEKTSAQKEDKPIDYPSVTLRKQVPSKKHVHELAIDFETLTKSLMGERIEVDMGDYFKVKTAKKKSSSKRVRQKDSSVKANSLKQCEDNVVEKKQVPLRSSLQDFSHLGELEQHILQILEKDSPLAPDEILVQLPEQYLDVSKLNRALLMLEVENLLCRQSGNSYSLVWS